ncbi:uncharacterized protein LOC143856520 [Tasmannia lanceolata]|uniref:uncharacterized protein LOC143856520 n=1 Tax=Tasmannia lanceolata TaxID=3420 RepID=UPI0040628178
MDEKKNADTHMMGNEEIKKHGVEGSKRPPGHNPGGVLHQRSNLPYSPMKMAVAGFLIVTTIGYITLYSKKKPEATAGDVAKATLGLSGDISGDNRSN